MGRHQSVGGIRAGQSGGKIAGCQAACRWRRRGPDRCHSGSPAVRAAGLILAFVPVQTLN